MYFYEMVGTLLSSIHRGWYDRSLDYSLHGAGRFHGFTVSDQLSYHSIPESVLATEASRIDYCNVAGSAANLPVGYSNDPPSNHIISSSSHARLALSCYDRSINARILFLFSIHLGLPRSVYLIKYGCLTERLHPRFYLCP